MGHAERWYRVANCCAVISPIEAQYHHHFPSPPPHPHVHTGTGTHALCRNPTAYLAAAAESETVSPTGDLLISFKVAPRHRVAVLAALQRSRFGVLLCALGGDTGRVGPGGIGVKRISASKFFSLSSAGTKPFFCLLVNCGEGEGAHAPAQYAGKFFFRGTGLPTVMRKSQPLVPRSNFGGKACARTARWFRGQTSPVPGHVGGGGACMRIPPASVSMCGIST